MAMNVLLYVLIAFADRYPIIQHTGRDALISAGVPLSSAMSRNQSLYIGGLLDVDQPEFNRLAEDIAVHVVDPESH